MKYCLKHDTGYFAGIDSNGAVFIAANQQDACKWPGERRPMALHLAATFGLKLVKLT